MALNDSQQFFTLIKESTSPVICLPKTATPDEFAAALALEQIVTATGKKATIVSALALPPQLSFLKGNEKMKTNFENLRTFKIELDASKTKVHGLSYEMKNERLEIQLTPKSGGWTAEDVKFIPAAYRHDLIIAIGATEREAFGRLFELEKDFFFKTPLINLDHRAANERFGSFNLVDVTAASCGEVVFDLLKAFDQSLISEQVATALLTGIIAKTNSFKGIDVSPRSLERAGELMKKGADRDLIAQHLYRTRSLPTLRLWGRALARLKSDPAHGLVWTLISREDMLQAGEEETSLPDVMEELITSTPDAKTTVLLYENRDRNIVAHLRTDIPHDARSLLAGFDPVGDHAHAQTILKNKTIVEAEKTIIESVINQLKNA